MQKKEIEEGIRQGLVGSEVLCELENIACSSCIVTTYNQWILFYKNHDDKVERFEFFIEKNVQKSFLPTKESLTRLTGLLYSCMSWDDLRKKSFFPYLSDHLVKDLCDILWLGLQICIAIDEFTKCLPSRNDTNQQKTISKVANAIRRINGTLIISGFRRSDGQDISTASSRPVNTFCLSPVTISERAEFEPLRERIKDYYVQHKLLFPFYLNECVTFSPGLMGLWLEVLNKDKSIVFEELNPPILGTIISIVSKDKLYFSTYWIQCFQCIPMHGQDVECNDIFRLACLDQYEDHDAIIHLSIDAGFLNPFLVLRPSVFKVYNNEERQYFGRIYKAFWSAADKGNSLEEMLLCALGLRQLYSCTMPLCSVAAIVCGRLVNSYHTASWSADVDSDISWLNGGGTYLPVL